MKNIANHSQEILATWLLGHCYLKTVKRHLPDTWLVPRWFTWHHKPVMLGNTRVQSTLFWRHLFESEILLNYFGLEVSSYQASRYRHPAGAEYFGSYDEDMLKRPDGKGRKGEDDAYSAAREALSKTTRNLLKEGLIDIQEAHPNASRIRLTQRGESNGAKSVAGL